MKTIKDQSIYSSIYSYMGVIVGFISQGILIPNYLSKEQNGLLGILLSYMYIFIQLASLGFTSAGSRYFPVFNERKGKGGYLFFGILISLLGFCLFAGIFSLIKPWLLGRGEANRALFDTYFWVIYPISLGTVLFNLFDGYLKNLYNTVTGTILNQLFQRLIILVGLILIASIGIEFDTFLWIWISAFVLPTILIIIKSSSIQGFDLRPDVNVFTPSFTKDFFYYSNLTMLTGFSSMIIMYIDKIMLNHYDGLSDTGVYHTAAFFSSIMAMSLIAMNKAAFPVIVNALKKEDYQTVAVIYKKSCLMQLIVGCLIFGGILINLDAFFQLVPQGYEAGKWVIIILGFGKLFDLATGLNGTILILSKYYKYDSIIMVTLIIITILLNMIFIPPFGIVGAAFSATLSTIYFNVIRFWIVWKKMKMQPFNQDTLIVFLLAAIVTFAIYLMPEFEGNPIILIINMAYRSLFLTCLFIYAIYRSRVSPDANQVIDGLLKYIRIKK